MTRNIQNMAGITPTCWHQKRTRTTGQKHEHTGANTRSRPPNHKNDKPSPSPFCTICLGIPDPKANTATNDNTPPAETKQNEDTRKQINEIMALNGSGDEWRTSTTDKVPVWPQEAETDPPNTLGHGETIDSIIGGEKWRTGPPAARYIAQPTPPAKNTPDRKGGLSEAVKTDTTN